MHAPASHMHILHTHSRSLRHPTVSSSPALSLKNLVLLTLTWNQCASSTVTYDCSNSCSHTRWEAPLLILLCIPPHNLLKATISSLLFVKTVNTVIYVIELPYEWYRGRQKMVQSHPPFSSCCFSQHMHSRPKPSTWRPAISCDILPCLKQGILHHAVWHFYLLLWCWTPSGKVFIVCVASIASCSVSVLND